MWRVLTTREWTFEGYDLILGCRNVLRHAEEMGFVSAGDRSAMDDGARCILRIIRSYRDGSEISDGLRVW